jgi:hypothetical protein
MTTLENPSAGKFGAPPPPGDPNAVKPVRSRWWFAPLIFVALFGVKYWLQLPDGAGRRTFGVLAPFVAVGIGVVNYLLTRMTRDANAAENVDSAPTHPTE